MDKTYLKYTVRCNEDGCINFYYARGKCRKHYRVLLGKEGGYIKDYQKRKDNPVFKEMKKVSDHAYRERLRQLGLLSKKQHEYYEKFISNPKNRENKNNLLKIKYSNLSGDEKQKSIAYGKISRDRTKYEVMFHYSKGTLSCKHCGIDVYPLLTIDHINNDGAEHRRKICHGKASSLTYTWLRKNSYPEGFQVLCQNCNYFKDMIRRISKPTTDSVL